MTSPKKQNTKAVLAAFFSNLIFGFSFLFSNTALKYSSPSVLLAIRFVLAFLVMNILAGLKIVKLDFKKKKIYRIIIMGLFQPVIYFYCESYGMKLSSATFSAVMIALVPIGAMLCSAIFMKEPPSVLQSLFGILSVIGVILLSGKAESVTFWGTVLLIGAIICAVGFNALSRKSSDEFSPFERTYIMFATASVIFTIVALIENRSNLSALYTPLCEPDFLISVLYLGILSSVVAFMLINYANSSLPISQTTVFSNVITIVSIFSGIFILKDTALSFENILCSLMIVIGIFGVQKYAKSR